MNIQIQTKPTLERLGILSRILVAWILAGMSTNLRTQDVEWRIAQRSVREQVVLVGFVILALAFLTLVFAQAGWGGVVAFWGALYFVIR